MRRALPLLASILLACGGDPPPIPLDASFPDAGGHFDGGRLDASLPDGSPSSPDGAVSDGDVVDPPDDAGIPTCTAGDVHKLGEDRRRDRVVGLSAGATGFGLGWNAVPDGEALGQVFAATLSSSGELGSPQRLTDGAATRQPVTLTVIGTTWLAGWVDNATDSYELHALPLAADLTPGTSAQVTDTPTAAEDSPAFLVDGDGALLAWVETDATDTRVARAVRLNAEGAPAGAAVTASDGHQPSAIVLAELASGPALLYSAAADAGDGPTAHVFLQPLRDDGSARGSATTVDAAGGPDGTLDAALTPSGGAVVFGVQVGGVRREVRFRSIDEEGALLGDERTLVEGTDASIAAFAGGYAVSYRSSDGVRLIFVSATGEVVAELPIAEATPEGGRTTVRVSGDGQIAVAWANTTADGTTLHVASVGCTGSGS